MIYRSTRRLKRQSSFGDLRKAETAVPHITIHQLPTIITIPALSGKFNREFKRGQYSVNPFKQTCQCEPFTASESKYRAEDIRRLCTHLCAVYVSNAKKETGELLCVLLETQRRFGAEDMYKIATTDGDGYLGYRKDSAWLNVYVRAGEWLRYGWHIEQRRWSDNMPPPRPEELIEKINTVFIVYTGSKEQ